MNTFRIDNNILIDDVELVLECLSEHMDRTLTDIEIIGKFVNDEKATKFYLDGKMNSRMESTSDSVYLWIDSGFLDKRGNPLFISLLKQGSEYIGHYVGTIHSLSQYIINYFPRNGKQIKTNRGTFLGKYNQKIAGRTVKHIENEQEYLVERLNDNEEQSAIARLIEQTGYEAPANEEEVIERITVEEVVAKEAQEERQTAFEENISISLLWDKIDELERLNSELIAKLEVYEADKQEMETIKRQNAEYKVALTQMRLLYTEGSYAKEAAEPEEAHDLLGRNKKILVLGNADFDESQMLGIAKAVGFDKSDLEFCTDYDKVVNEAARLQNCAKYEAVIFGQCPHKVKKNAGYSSLIERFKQEEGLPFSVDARSKAGQLKVTKESFKTALLAIRESLIQKKLSLVY